MPQRHHRQPISSTRRRLGLGSLVVVVAVFLLSVPGCDEDRLDLPTDRTGVICGRIHDGAGIEPDYVTVVAESPAGVHPRARVAAHPDEDGRFWLTVPEGPVTVRVEGVNGRSLYWRADSPTSYSSEATPIIVAGGVREIDFACGRVHARVALSPDIASGPWKGSLVRTDDLDCVVARSYYEVTDDLDIALSLIPPGDYFLEIESPEQAVVFVPATYDTAVAEILTVRADEETSHDSAIAEHATLSGTVTGSWQVLGFDRPSVAAYFGTRAVASKATDAAGAFSVPLLTGGTFRLRVGIGGVARWIGGEDFDTATTYTLVPGQEVTGISHVESGLVCEFDASGPVPATIYSVVLRSTTGVIYDGDHWSSVIQLANLAPGEVFLRVDDWGLRDVWYPQYWDRHDDLADADPIVIPAGGGVAHVTVTLVQGARVLGRLLDVQGQPLSTDQLFVMVYATTDSAHIANLYTNWDFGHTLYDEDDGDYMLTQLRDGQYKMRARAADTDWTWWPGRACWDSAGVLTIENAADLSGVDWRLLY